MDSNGQFVQAPPPWQQATPAAAPARRWIPAAIIAAAILVGLLGGAAILRHGKTDTPATPVTTQAADGKTCQAWKTARATIATIPDLPPGWNWDTPNIDANISNLVASTDAAIELFTARITPEPPELADAANAYVDAARNQSRALSERSFTGADGTTMTDAAAQLSQLCGMAISN